MVFLYANVDIFWEFNKNIVTLRKEIPQFRQKSFMVSFIIINFNTYELTAKCVESIIRHVPEGTFEIIVVDNASQETDRIKLKETISDKCMIVESKVNLGFGAGNMLGANQAKGEFLCFLNSDVELTENCVTPLCEFLTENPDVGCVTPQQYDAKGKQARSFRHKTGIRHELFGDSLFQKLCPRKFPNPDQDFNGRIIEVGQVNGSFMMFPADKFWDVGGFDINIFLYYEEYDMGIRMNKKGWKNIVMTKYKFKHIHGATIKKHKSMTKRELYISKIYTYSKHHNWLLSAIYRMLNLVVLAVKPSKWYILRAVFHGNTLGHSIRHQMSKSSHG